MVRNAAVGLFIGVVGLACDNSTAPKTGDTVATPPATTQAVATTTKVTDSQGLATITAMSQGEVDQANTALPKLANGDAKDFATMMQKQHGEALAKLSSIATEQKITPADNTTSTELKMQSTQVVSKLSADAAGPAYDRAYMQAQIDGHTAALKLIDTQLLPNIDNVAFKDCVNELRGHVQEHLSKAQSVLQGLPST